ncbi:polysaccharide deacetylase [Actinosynnema pretiosum]|uniref:Polysaccharide deacetylase n=1 Tax=Actinosynnema pretiosum TaxID=42197 RepID=A0A290Z0B8_9PSEU|nr:polysaccharide deacetylase [Actinosynnema pretiosum]
MKATSGRNVPSTRVVKRWGWLSTVVALAVVLVVLAVLGARESPPGGGAGEPAARLPGVTTGSSASAAPAPTVPPHPDPPSWMRRLQPGEKPPQFLLFSFDGAASKEHWDRLNPIAARTGAHVTGLLSGVYLLTEQQGAATYRGPKQGAGRSDIGFGGTQADVELRIGYLNQAIDDGHEIGTHYNGHFCAGGASSVGDWDTADWGSELEQFFQIVEKARAKGFKLDPSAVRGGRTPCLEGRWDQAFPAMRQRGLVYDTSHVSLGVQWPSVRDGVWEFPMPEVRVPALGKQVVMMDFNLWYALDGAKEKTDPANVPLFTQVVVDTYRSVLRAAANGNRAPVVIGNHFNDWAGGAFSEAVERFMGEACGAGGAVCATYTEVLQWMQLQDPEVLEHYRRMPAAMN